MQLIATQNARSKPSRGAGFTLIEVLVTLVILSIGLLGVAKLQAAAISNTQVSRMRSLVALQAGSLAAAMHANQAYWAFGSAPASFTVSGTTSGTTVGGALGAPPPSGGCQGTATATPCTPLQIATVDVQNWASNLGVLLPTYSGTVTCTTVPPIGCRIALTWTEKYVATNNNTAQGTQTGSPTFTMFVAP